MCYNAAMKDHYAENSGRMRKRFAKSCKKKGAKPLFGLELEQFLVDSVSYESIAYEGADGVEGILNELRPCYTVPTYSEGRLIGLSREDLAITIEPAAQFEVSISPQTEIGAIDRIYRRFEDEIRPILSRRHLSLVACGYQPKSRIDDLPLIPKKRYEFMYRYFRKLNGLGPNMMKGTASVHFSIDYFCEENFSEKYGVVYALAPVLSFLTENTHVYEGKPYSGHLLRMKIWEETDPLRVDVQSCINEGGMNFDRYIGFVAKAPVIVEESGEGEVYSEKTIGELMSERTYDDAGLDHLLSMVFPLIRVKSFLEIRVADSMPYEAVRAYMLLIKGLFTVTDDACSYVKRLLEGNPDWYASAYEKISRDGAEASFSGKTLRSIVQDITELALSHLKGEEKEYLASYEPNLKREGRLLV